MSLITWLGALSGEGLTGPDAGMLGFQVVELSGKDWEV